jgi:Tfp pilus assembly protein PilV
MKTLKSLIKSNTGSIFIEVLISLILISMLLLTFMSMFVTSANVNKRSRDVLDATYFAQNLMEELYDLSLSKSLETSLAELQNSILTDSFHEEIADEQVILGKYDDKDVAITIKDTEDEKLSLVKVEVYSDDTYTQSQAVMQSNFLWQSDDVDDPEDPTPTDIPDPEKIIVLHYVTVENRVYSGNDKKMAYTLAFTFTENGEPHIAYDLTTRHVNFNSMNFPIIQKGSIGVGYETVDYEIKLTKESNGGKPDLRIEILDYKVRE